MAAGLSPQQPFSTVLSILLLLAAFAASSDAEQLNAATLRPVHTPLMRAEYGRSAEGQRNDDKELAGLSDDAGIRSSFGDASLEPDQQEDGGDNDAFVIDPDEDSNQGPEGTEHSNEPADQLENSLVSTFDPASSVGSVWSSTGSDQVEPTHAAAVTSYESLQMQERQNDLQSDDADGGVVGEQGSMPIDEVTEDERERQNTMPDANSLDEESVFDDTLDAPEPEEDPEDCSVFGQTTEAAAPYPVADRMESGTADNAVDLSAPEEAADSSMQGNAEGKEAPTGEVVTTSEAEADEPEGPIPAATLDDAEGSDLQNVSMLPNWMSLRALADIEEAKKAIDWSSLTPEEPEPIIDVRSLELESPADGAEADQSTMDNLSTSIQEEHTSINSEASPEEEGEEDDDPSNDYTLLQANSSFNQGIHHVEGILVPGDVVYLHSAIWNRYVRINDGQADRSSEWGTTFPLWDWERFTVFDGGNGEIALHNKRWNRFLRMNDGFMDASAPSSTLPAGWTWERFKVLNVGSGKIGLHSRMHNRYVKMGPAKMEVTEQRNLGDFPSGWTWERFTVVKAPLAPGDRVGFYNTIFHRWISLSATAVAATAVTSDARLASWRTSETFEVVDGPGTKIGLRCNIHKRFLSIRGDKMYPSAPMEVGAMPNGWDFSFWDYIYLGPNRVGLHNSVANRYAKMENGNMFGSVPAGPTFPNGWTWEAFEVKREPLNNGDVVAFWSPWYKRFLRLHSNGIADRSDEWDGEGLRADWGWERFTIVDVGNGDIAIHSPIHNKFLRMNSNGHIDSCCTMGVNEFPTGWTWERFRVVDRNGQIGLHNRAHNKYIRLTDSGAWSSLSANFDYLPDGWAAEHFKVIKVVDKRVITPAKPVVVEGALTPGDSIFLHNPTWNRFVMASLPEARSSPVHGPDLIRYDWLSEKWTVVDGGGGTIALHNKFHNRFLRMNGAIMDLSGTSTTLPSDWSYERFKVVDIGDGHIGLHNAVHNRFVRMNNEKMDCTGLQNLDTFNPAWTWERFKVVKAPISVGDTVSLYNTVFKRFVDLDASKVSSSAVVAEGTVGQTWTPGSFEVVDAPGSQFAFRSRLSHRFLGIAGDQVSPSPPMNAETLPSGWERYFWNALDIGPGRVGLHNLAANRFLKMDNERIIGSAPSGATFPNGWTWEAFTVVKEALKPGDVVAFWCPIHKRFLHMNSGGGGGYSEITSGYGLPFGWMWERFTVVDGGNGEIGLHSAVHNRFLRMNSDGRLDSHDQRNVLPSDWPWERFRVVARPNGEIGLHSKAHNKYISMTYDGVCASGVRNFNDLPDGWTWQHFKVIKVLDKRVLSPMPTRVAEGILTPGDVVYLHNFALQRFILINQEKAGVSGVLSHVKPPVLTWEKFTVVDGGNGEIALHNKVFNRFLRMNGDKMDASGVATDLPAGWTFERFKVVDIGWGQIALYNKIHNRFVAMTATGLGVSVPTAVDKFESSWAYMHFTVVKAALAPGDTVALYNNDYQVYAQMSDAAVQVSGKTTNFHLYNSMSWERFEVTEAPAHQIGLHSKKHNRFLCMSFSQDLIYRSVPMDGGSLPNDWPESFWTLVDASNGKIALHNDHANKFLKTMPPRLGWSPIKGFNELPDNWSAERYTVVKDKLKHGDVVAFFNQWEKRFLRLNDKGKVDVSEVCSGHGLDVGWGWERFTVVDAGNEEYAFHNKVHNKFIRMNDGVLDAGGQANVDALAAGWQWERFKYTVLPSGDIGLHNKAWNKYVKMTYDSIGTTTCNYDALPHNWLLEHFTVVKVVDQRTTTTTTTTVPARFIEGALVPGDVVYLYNAQHNRYITMKFEQAIGSALHGPTKVPGTWTWEKWTVVDGGNGQIALHNKIFNRFLRMNGDKMDASAVAKDLPAGWTYERFKVVDAGAGQIALHSAVHNRFVNMNGEKMGTSGVVAADKLGATWKWERFSIIKAAMAPGDIVGLYCAIHKSFVNMNDKSVMTSGVVPNHLYNSLTWERFEVTEAPENQIGLHSKLFNRFLSIDGEKLFPSEERNGDQLPSNWTSQFWVPVDVGPGEVGLHNTQANRYLKMSTDHMVVTAPTSVLGFPDGWTWERFKVVKDAIKQGDVVAFYNKIHRRFLRLHSNGKVDLSAECSGNGLDMSWTWERFTVVDAGNEEYAFHSKIHNKFIRMNDGFLDSGAPANVDALGAGWQWERFKYTLLPSGEIGLHNKHWNKYVKMAPAASATSEARNYNDFPAGWTWEAFQVVKIVDVRTTTTTTTTVPPIAVEGALTPGDVVFLHSKFHNRFVSLIDTKGLTSGVHEAGKIPGMWTGERFTVVDGGNGQIALHNKAANRFLRMNHDKIDASSPSPAAALPAGWTWERFTVIDAGDGQIALHNKVHNRFVSLSDDKMVCTSKISSDRLNPHWTWERFTVVKAPLTPGDEVALYNGVHKRFVNLNNDIVATSEQTSDVRLYPSLVAERFEVTDAPDFQIGLHSKPFNRFLAMKDDKVFPSAPMPGDRLPVNWTYEFWTVVDLARDQVGLHNEKWNRYLKMDNDKVIASTPAAATAYPAGWTWESFTVVRDPIKPGDVVAFWNKIHRRFLRLHSSGNVDYSTPCSGNGLPATWGWERFTVVDAGNGELAFHSKIHNKFIRMHDSILDSSVVTNVDQLPSDWTWVRFKVVVNPHHEIGLHNKQWNKYISMTPDGACSSTPRNYNDLPLGWTWQSFKVVKIFDKRTTTTTTTTVPPLPIEGKLVPGDIVYLHNKVHNRFVRLNEMMAETSAPASPPAPPDWSWEKFTVVDAGRGQVALHNAKWNRFLSMNGTNMMGSAPCHPDQLPAGWTWERFTVIDGGFGLIGLHNAFHNRFLRMQGQILDTSVPVDADKMPWDWTWEKFRVVKVQIVPGETIQLKSSHWHRYVELVGNKATASAVTAGSLEDPSSKFYVVSASDSELALYNDASRSFLRMQDSKVDGSSPIDANKLPSSWSWERFTLVDVGHWQIALHNAQWNRFLRLHDSQPESSEPHALGLPLPGWTWERFYVKKERLVHGDIVAFHNARWERFVGLHDAASVKSNWHKSWSSIPVGWFAERFKVVDAGHGEVALHNVNFNRFLRMTSGGQIDAPNQIASDKLPTSWAWERFVVVELGKGEIGLYNKAHGRFLRMSDKGIDVSGKVAPDKMPTGWSWERFRIVKVVDVRTTTTTTTTVKPVPVQGFVVPGDVVYLYNSEQEKFIKASTGEVKTTETHKPWKVPASWTWAKWTVVDAHHGEVAFHSVALNRYLSMNGDTVETSPEMGVHDLPRNWKKERFTVVDGGSGTFALHNKENNRFIKMHGDAVEATDKKDAESLPWDWQHARFKIVKAPIVPGERIALRSSVSAEFLSMAGNKAACSVASPALSLVPRFPWNDFYVVDGGNDEIALHNMKWNRFLRLHNSEVDASDEKAAEKLPREWSWERFTVVDAGWGRIALHSRVWKKFVQIHDNVVDASPEMGPDELSKNHTAQKFEIVKDPVAPDEIVAFYSDREHRFIDVQKESVGQSEVWNTKGAIPLTFQSNHFKVIHAGKGEVGLWNIQSKRFLRVHENGVAASAEKGEKDAAGAEERFRVLDAGWGQVVLFNNNSNSFVKMTDKGLEVSAAGPFPSATAAVASLFESERPHSNSPYQPQSPDRGSKGRGGGGGARPGGMKLSSATKFRVVKVLAIRGTTTTTTTVPPIAIEGVAVPGEIISLHNKRSNRFVTLKEDQVNVSSPHSPWRAPPSWLWIKFLIVDGGSGQVALYNMEAKRFLLVEGRKVLASEVMDSADLPDDLNTARLTFVEAGNGEVALHSKEGNRFVRMNQELVDTSGNKKVTELPWTWSMERFRVVKVPLAPGQTVALHNEVWNKLPIVRDDKLGASHETTPVWVPWWQWDKFYIVDAGQGQIALYNAYWNRFMRLHDAQADASSEMAPEKLPPSWSWERFTVVDAGWGKIALHNSKWNRFLRMNKMGMDGSSTHSADSLPHEWTEERFTVVKPLLVPGDIVGLHSREFKKFIRVHDSSVDCSDVHDRKSIPQAWTWERFVVVGLPHGEVALYSVAWGRFLRMKGELVTVTEKMDQEKLPPWWESTRFQVVNAGKGEVSFYNRRAARFLRMNHGTSVDASSVITDYKSMPKEWSWEKFQIIKVKAGITTTTTTTTAKPLAIQGKLVPGDSVYLWGKSSKSLLQISEDKAQASAPHMPWGIPSEWIWEKFMVMDAGQGQVALFNPGWGRYLKLDGENVVASQPTTPGPLPPDRTGERFTVVDGGYGYVALHNTYHNRFVTMSHHGVKASSPKPVADFPWRWDHARFKVIKAALAPGDLVSLYNEQERRYVEEQDDDAHCSEQASGSRLPDAFTSGTWNVVDAGQNQVALHNVEHNRFLGMTADGQIKISVVMNIPDLPSFWTMERFTVVDADEQHQIALHNTQANSFLAMRGSHLGANPGDVKSFAHIRHKSSVTFKVVKDPLMPGNIVAFHNRKQGRYVSLFDRQADRSPPCSGWHIPVDWDSQLFKVIPVGKGEIALWSQKWKRYLRMTEDQVDGSMDLPNERIPSTWSWERFTVVDAGKGAVALYCKRHQRFLYMSDSELTFSNVTDIKELPAELEGAQFNVLKVGFQPVLSAPAPRKPAPLPSQGRPPAPSPSGSGPRSSSSSPSSSARPITGTDYEGNTTTTTHTAKWVPPEGWPWQAAPPAPGQPTVTPPPATTTQARYGAWGKSMLEDDPESDDGVSPEDQADPSNSALGEQVASLNKDFKKIERAVYSELPQLISDASQKLPNTENGAQSNSQALLKAANKLDEHVKERESTVYMPLSKLFDKVSNLRQHVLRALQLR